MNVLSSSLDGGYDRVRHHTAPVVNRRIDLETRGTVEEIVARGRDAIVARLAELDREWDVDRALMATFAVLGGASCALGLERMLRTSRLRPPRKGFLGLFAVQMGFLLVHATIGWCPPVAVLRRLGVRTTREIDAERSVLLASLATAR